MMRKIVWSVVAVLVLAVAGTFAYQYYYAMYMQPAVPLPPAAQPDNTVNAGIVNAVTVKSVTIVKQDGTATSFAINASTTIQQAGENGQAGPVQKVSDIKTGMMVLIVPGQDATIAQSITLIPAPPTQ